MLVEAGGIHLEVTVPAGVNIGDAFQFVIGAPTEQPSIGADPSMALQRLHSVQQLAQAEGGDRPRILAEYEGALGDLMPLLRTAPDPDGSLRREVTEADLCYAVKEDPEAYYHYYYRCHYYMFIIDSITIVVTIPTMPTDICHYYSYYAYYAVLVIIIKYAWII